MVMTVEELTKKYPLPKGLIWEVEMRYTAISQKRSWSRSWAHWYVWTDLSETSRYDKGQVYAHKPWEDPRAPSTSVLLATIIDLDEACQFMAHKALFGLYE